MHGSTALVPLLQCHASLTKPGALTVADAPDGVGGLQGLGQRQKRVCRCCICQAANKLLVLLCRRSRLMMRPRQRLTLSREGRPSENAPGSWLRRGPMPLGSLLYRLHCIFGVPA